MIYKPINYLAHSKNLKGELHYLKDHLSSVATKAAKFMMKEYKELAYYAGLWHDIGKVNERFQQKLVQGTSDRIDHKGAGVVLANQIGSKIIQFAIAGHHGGLVNPAEIGSWFSDMDRSDLKLSLKKIREYIGNLLPEKRNILTDPNQPTPKLDILTRMLFSALVDADFLDTENHFNPKAGEKRRVPKIHTKFLEKYEHYHQQLTKEKSGEINDLRKAVYESCVLKSSEPPGFFRLTVPTGGGKTLSSLAFALNHGLKHKKERVIYAIPYTSIIEQTAGIFKHIFPSMTVLEHHTGVHSADPEEYTDDYGVWNRLASENWDAPIVVTTNVQLFESLFGRTPSFCRKLHNIANSVIILDEAQTLPLPLFPTIMDALKDLVQHFGVTVVFCTATQPALDQFLKEASIKVKELAPDPKTLFQKLERVRYQNHAGEPWAWRKVVQTMRKTDRSMAVVNTKKDARELWEAFDDDSVYHLSAAMCPAHRMDVLNEIREKLVSRKFCYLMATQVVEAGVDIDFDCVLRAIGPLDRIVQAAGRCNREGKMDKGDVIIFNPESGSVPKGVYGVGKHKAEQLLSDPKLDLNDPDTFPAYFDSVRRDITERQDIEEDRDRLYFRTVAEKFKMIEEDTYNVVVEYKPKMGQIKKLVNQLKTQPEQAFYTLRELQPFTVSLRSYEVEKSQHLLEQIYPGLFYWHGRYHLNLGLLKEIDLSKPII